METEGSGIPEATAQHPASPRGFPRSQMSQTCQWAAGAKGPVGAATSSGPEG